MNVLGLFRLETPMALWLLLALPLWWLWRRKRSEGAIVFSRTGVLAKGPRAGQLVARAIFFLRNVALVALIIALARPRTGARVENVTTSGINIVLAVDLSSSMLAEDFQPSNRLEVAKTKLSVVLKTNGRDTLTVKDGTLRISIAAIKSGALPGLAALLARK